jgi:hypothetical protein
MHIEYLWESQMERDHYEEQDVGGWTILKWIIDTCRDSVVGMATGYRLDD